MSLFKHIPAFDVRAIKARRREGLGLWGHALLYPFLLLILSESIVRGGLPHGLDWLRKAPAATLLTNYAVFFLCLNVFQPMRRRGLFFMAQGLSTALLLALALADAMKLETRLQPIIPSDVTLILPALRMLPQYYPHFYPLAAALIVSVCAALGWVGHRLWHRKRPQPCMACFYLSLGLIVCTALYIRGDLNSFPRKALRAGGWQEQFALRKNAMTNGTAFTLLESFSQSAAPVPPPQGYSKAQVQALLEGLPETMPEEAPNLIIILGESVIDVQCLNGLELSIDPTPTLRGLKAEHTTGRLTVAGYGGGTYQAETAVLTGLPHAPFQGYQLPSIAHMLSLNGYRTAAIHNYWGWFYDRSTEYRRLGFDLFLPLEALPGAELTWPYPRDAAAYDAALERMRMTPERDFIYIATMETHGGYQYAPLYEHSQSRPPLEPEAENELNNYITLLRRADTALGDFILALSALAEPTAVLFFGDHYPSIPLVLEGLGTDMDSPELYQTGYCLWTNFGLPKRDADLPIEALSAYALGLLELPMTPVQRLRHTLPAETESAALEALCYDLLHGERFQNALLGLNLEGEGYQIGYPPQIEGAALLNRSALLIQGRNIGLYPVLSFAGKRYPMTGAQGCYAFLPLAESLYEKMQNGPELTLLQADNQNEIFQASEPFYAIDCPEEELPEALRRLFAIE